MPQLDRIHRRAPVFVLLMLVAGLSGDAQQTRSSGQRYSISGRVVDFLRLQPEDAVLMIGRENNGSFSSAPLPVGADGAFVAKSLEPGIYVLEVVRTPHSATKPAVPVAFSLVHVKDVDVAGVVVTVRRDTALTGRFRMESNNPAAAWPPHIVVNAFLALEGTPFAGGKVADGAPGGTFILHNAFGPRVIRCGYTLAPESRWWPSRVFLDGVDITNVPTDFSAHEKGELEVVFTQHPPRLTGTVKDVYGAPVWAPWIVVMSADTSLWQPWATTSSVTQGDTKGGFSLAMLPGDYLVRAVPQSTFNSWQTARARIHDYAARGVPVTVGETGTSTVALTIPVSNPR